MMRFAVFSQARTLPWNTAKSTVYTKHRCTAMPMQKVQESVHKGLEDVGSITPVSKPTGHTRPHLSTPHQYHACPARSDYRDLLHMPQHFECPYKSQVLFASICNRFLPKNLKKISNATKDLNKDQGYIIIALKLYVFEFLCHQEYPDWNPHVALLFGDPTFLL